MATREEADRVRVRTPEGLNAQIDHCTASRVSDYATRSGLEIESYMAKLDRAWALDRALVAISSGLAMAAIALGSRRRSWLILAGLTSASLLRFALDGGGLGAAMLRRLGFRTRREIDSERCALKALRGDFELVRSARSPIALAGNALQAALR